MLLALILVALAQPYAVGRRAEQHSPAVVFLVDHSDSVGDAAASVASLIEGYSNALSSGVRTSALEFAGSAWPAGTPRPVQRDGTNIAKALDVASTEFSDSANRQFILFTDGQGTTGVANLVAQRLCAQGDTIHVVPIGQKVPRGPRIIGVTPPSAATIGRPTRVEARLASDWPADVTVRLLDSEGVEQARKRITIDGQRVLTLTMKPERGGVNDCVLIVSDENTSPARVLTLRTPFYVTGGPRILLVDPAVDQLGYLTSALGPLKVELDTVVPPQLPATLSELQRYEAVIISDCPRPALSDEQVQALSSFVERRGGGLVFVGGVNVNSEEWRSSPLEKLLPINFIPELSERPPAHVCFVLDRSGSMDGWKLGLVKSAVGCCLDNLPPNTLVSVVVFDETATVIVRRQSVEQKQSVLAKVNAVAAGGGTTMGPAVRAALALLESTPAARYMILLTDGQCSDQADQHLWQSLSSEMQVARVRTTGIAMGHDASQTILQFLSLLTGGKYHLCLDPSLVPSVFIREADTIDEDIVNRAGRFHPLPGPDVDMLRTVSADILPELTGCVAAKPKPDVLVKTQLLRDKRRVLLASWYYGAGRVVAFTGSAKPTWAERWISSPETGRLWTEIVRWAMSDTRKYQAETKSLVDGQSVRTLVRVVDAESGLPALNLAASATIEALCDDAPMPSRMTCKELRPGLYEFKGLCAGSGNHRCHVQMYSGDDLAVDVTAVVQPARPPELAATGPNLQAIQALCEAGGGRVDPSPAQIAALAQRSQPVEITTTIEYWRCLLFLAVLCWPIDVAMRRLFA